MVEERNVALGLIILWLLWSVFQPDQCSHLEPSSSLEVLAAESGEAKGLTTAERQGTARHNYCTLWCVPALYCRLRSACHVAHRTQRWQNCMRAPHAVEAGSGSQALLHLFLLAVVLAPRDKFRRNAKVWQQNEHRAKETHPLKIIHKVHNRCCMHKARLCVCALFFCYVL